MDFPGYEPRIFVNITPVNPNGVTVVDLGEQVDEFETPREGGHSSLPPVATPGVSTLKKPEESLTLGKEKGPPSEGNKGPHHEPTGGTQTRVTEGGESASLRSSKVSRSNEGSGCDC